MQFFAKELHLLGHVIKDGGIVMDPAKVDRIENWKIPTSKQLLSEFLGAVGFLAPGAPTIRIPMGVLHRRAGKTADWRWTLTEQRAFEQIKLLVSKFGSHTRKSLSYAPNAPPIYVICDASYTGAAGVLSQGINWKDSIVAAFWSGKFNSTQQNYPVHEQELLAIVESLKRFRPMLLGCKFIVLTDHKSLQYFLTQKNLSPRQARWLEALSEFDFEVEYIPGETNILADALSCIYAEDCPGVVRAPSEFVSSYKSKVPTCLHAMKLVSALVDIIATVDEPDLTLQTRRGTIRHINVKQFTKKCPRKFI